MYDLAIVTSRHPWPMPLPLYALVREKYWRCSQSVHCRAGGRSVRGETKRELQSRYLSCRRWSRPDRSPMHQGDHRQFRCPRSSPTPLVSVMILTVLEESPDVFYDLDCVEDIVRRVMSSISADSSAAARPAREARELMRKGRYGDDEKVQTLLR